MAQQRRAGVEERGALTAAVIGDRQRQFPFGCYVCDEVLEPAEEGVARTVLGQQGLAPGAELSHFFGVDGDDHIATGREVSVHRGAAEAGPAGDVVERGVDAVVVEDVHGCGHEQVYLLVPLGHPCRARARLPRPRPRRRAHPPAPDALILFICNEIQRQDPRRPPCPRHRPPARLVRLAAPPPGRSQGSHAPRRRPPPPDGGSCCRTDMWATFPPAPPLCG